MYPHLFFFVSRSTASLARRLQEDSLLTTSRNYSTICVVSAGGNPDIDLSRGFAR